MWVGGAVTTKVAAEAVVVAGAVAGAEELLFRGFLRQEAVRTLTTLGRIPAVKQLQGERVKCFAVSAR